MSRMEKDELYERLDKSIEKRKKQLETDPQSEQSTKLNIHFLEKLKKIQNLNIRDENNFQPVTPEIMNQLNERVILKQLHIYDVNPFDLIDLEVKLENSVINFIFGGRKNDKKIFFIELKILNPEKIETFISEILPAKKQFKKQKIEFIKYFKNNYKDNYKELTHMLFIYNENLNLFYIREENFEFVHQNR